MNVDLARIQFAFTATGVTLAVGLLAAGTLVPWLAATRARQAGSRLAPGAVCLEDDRDERQTGAVSWGAVAR